jgi:hypothetical protein
MIILIIISATTKSKRSHCTNIGGELSFIVYTPGVVLFYDNCRPSLMLSFSNTSICIAQITNV